MFGGRIQPVNGRVDCSHGMSVWDWPETDLDELPVHRITYYSVPMDYVQKLFQMETWQRVCNLRDWKIFHIPRNGATSLYLNCFTTMPWKEELRQMQLDYDEGLSLADPTEPAPKRREIRTGTAVVKTKGYGEEPEVEEPGNKPSSILYKEKSKQRASRDSIRPRKRALKKLDEKKLGDGKEKQNNEVEQEEPSGDQATEEFDDQKPEEATGEGTTTVIISSTVHPPSSTPSPQTSPSQPTTAPSTPPSLDYHPITSPPLNRSPIPTTTTSSSPSGPVIPALKPPSHTQVAKPALPLKGTTSPTSRPGGA